MTAIFRDQKVKNAIMIGTLCSCSYLGVYFARNQLSAVTPQIIEGGVYSTEYIGSLSSLYFTFYAVGQLLNGAVGDKIKARYMISFGLMLAGLCNVLFPSMLDSAPAAHLTYGMTGFFLSMTYAPMTKVVAENTEPIYATRCSLGYTFASFFGSPLAGVVAAILTWQSAFYCCSAALIVMGMVCFAVLLAFERKGIVRYGQYKPAKEQGRGGVGILIRHRIIRFSFVSIITGVVRTTVVFWMPTYISQYLGFSAEKAAVTFTAATFIISLTAFIAVFLYEKLGRNMELTMRLSFISAVIFFLLTYFVKAPVLNIACLVLAIMSSNCAAAMLWSRYCPSLRDTGRVSTATGFLDFLSYMAAAASTSIFANAAVSIGWGNLILVWCGLMAAGIIVMFCPALYKQKKG